jgi:hypothetical protein
VNAPGHTRQGSKNTLLIVAILVGVMFMVAQIAFMTGFMTRMLK